MFSVTCFKSAALPSTGAVGGHGPGLAPGLHLIGQSDVVGPDVELPLPESQHAAVHPAAVDAHSHVHVDPGDLSHQPAGRTQQTSRHQRGWRAFKPLNRHGNTFV